MNQMYVDAYQQELDKLIDAARDNGVVLTIHLAPDTPLRTGFYTMVGQARLANRVYRANEAKAREGKT